MNPELLRDWLTIWHSESAAMAVDREVLEAFRLTQPGHDAPGPARADAPPGAAAAVAAPDPRDRQIAELAARLDRVERTLAGLAG